MTFGASVGATITGKCMQCIYLLQSILAKNVIVSESLCFHNEGSQKRVSLGLQKSESEEKEVFLRSAIARGEVQHRGKTWYLFFHSVLPALNECMRVEVLCSFCGEI